MLAQKEDLQALGGVFLELIFSSLGNAGPSESTSGPALQRLLVDVFKGNIDEFRCVTNFEAAVVVSTQKQFSSCSCCECTQSADACLMPSLCLLPGWCVIHFSVSLLVLVCFEPLVSLFPFAGYSCKNAGWSWSGPSLCTVSYASVWCSRHLLLVFAQDSAAGGFWKCVCESAGDTVVRNQTGQTQCCCWTSGMVQAGT